MGFRPQQTIYNLTFEGTSLDGLHVKMSCCTIKEHAQMLKSSFSEIAAEGKEKTTKEIIEENNRIIEKTIDDNEWTLNLFVNHLLSWDLQDPIDGSPVPATRAGVDSQERSLIAQLVGAWQTAMVTLPNPSSSNSSNGETSEEASLDLGSSSESLGS